VIAMAGFGRCILKTFGSFLNELKDLVIGMGLRTLQQDVKKLIGLRLCIDFRIMLSNLCADVDMVKKPIRCRTAPLYGRIPRDDWPFSHS
jgi:hypothetical protein